jgi:outer membrane immunogenic protein
MLKAVFGAALLCALPTVAHAEAFDGPYAGVEGGLDNYELSAKGDAGFLDPALAGVDVKADGLSANGVAGGIFAGYNFAVSTAFVGVEGFGRESDANFKLVATDGTDTLGLRVRAKESYGVAGRVGFRVTPGTALFARVGWVNTRFKAAFNDGTGWVSGHDTQSGIEYGAGIETRLSPKVSLRAEYVAADYGSADLGDGVSLDNGSFRAGFAVHF